MSPKAVAVLLSALVSPGAGQIYNKDYFKGAALIAAAAGILASFIYNIWDAAVAATLTMTTDAPQGNLFGVAQSIMEANRGFYHTATLAFIIIWVVGVADAYIRGERQ